MPKSKNQKNKKTSSFALRATEDKKKQTTAAAKPKAKKPAAKKAVKKSAPEPVKIQVAPIPEKIIIKQEIKKPVSQSREELNNLIEQESLKENTIFSLRPHPSAQARPAPKPDVAPPIDTAPPEKDSYLYEPEEPVSIYRKILLWSSVGVCGALIFFGWFLTVGGSLGLGGVSQTQATYESEEIVNDLTEEFDNLKQQIDNNTEKAVVDDQILEDLANKIKNSTSTEESVATDEADIFSPPAEEE